MCQGGELGVLSQGGGAPQAPGTKDSPQVPPKAAGIGLKLRACQTPLCSGRSVVTGHQHAMLMGLCGWRRAPPPWLRCERLHSPPQ